MNFNELSSSERSDLETMQARSTPKSAGSLRFRGELVDCPGMAACLAVVASAACLLISSARSAELPNRIASNTNYFQAATPAEVIAGSLRQFGAIQNLKTNVSRATATEPLESAFPKANSTEGLDSKHRLAIGDRLSFRIEEDMEEPKPLIVTDSGELEVPYIGRFPAQTKTCKQLASELKAALEKEYYYRATVILAVDLMAKSRGKVYLVGPVRLPGPQEIPSDENLTLSKAIMRAGGFNDFADRRNVTVTRKAISTGGDKKTFVVDVGQIFDKGKVEIDLPLEPDDLILIPERLVRF
jgi:protein involved in polysaccharide export with SLBB domain